MSAVAELEQSTLARDLVVTRRVTDDRQRHLRQVLAVVAQLHRDATADTEAAVAEVVDEAARIERVWGQLRSSLRAGGNVADVRTLVAEFVQSVDSWSGVARSVRDMHALAVEFGLRPHGVEALARAEASVNAVRASAERLQIALATPRPPADLAAMERGTEAHRRGEFRTLDQILASRRGNSAPGE